MAGIRLEFAQFGHFDSFDVIRSITSMVGIADVDLPTPIATGLKTMYYVDANVVKGTIYYYKVRVWRGSTSFVCDELEAIAIEPYAVTYLKLEENTIDQGLSPRIFTNNGVTFSSKKAFFSGTSYLVTPAASEDYSFGTGPFTIELVASVSADGGGYALDMRRLYNNWSTVTSDYANLLYISETSVGWSNGSVFNQAFFTFTPGIEYAVAVTRDEFSMLRFFIDGEKKLEVFDNTNITGDRFLHVGLGRMQGGGVEFGFKGTIRRVRISKWIAKYVGDYTLTYQK